VSQNSKYECSDIAGASTLANSIYPGMSLTYTNYTPWYQYGQSVNISNTNLFGIDQQCNGKIVGDGIINGHDLWVFANIMLAIPPYNVPLHSQLTVQGRDDTRNRCRTSPPYESIQQWIYTIMIDSCATETSDFSCLSSTSVLTWDESNLNYLIDGSSEVYGLNPDTSYQLTVAESNKIRIFSNDICTISITSTNQEVSSGLTYHYGTITISIPSATCSEATYIVFEHLRAGISSNRLVYPCSTSRRRLNEQDEPSVLNMNIQTDSVIENEGRWVKIEIPRIVYSIDIILENIEYTMDHKLALSYLPYVRNVAPNKYDKNEWLRFERYGYENLENGKYDCQDIYGGASPYAMIKNVIMISQRQVCEQFSGVACLAYADKKLCPFNLYLWVPSHINTSPIIISPMSSAMDGVSGKYQKIRQTEQNYVPVFTSPPLPPSIPPSAPCSITENITLLVQNTSLWNQFSYVIDTVKPCHFNVNTYIEDELFELLTVINNNCLSSTVIILSVPFHENSIESSVVYEKINSCKKISSTKFIVLNDQKRNYFYDNNDQLDAYIGNSNFNMGYECAEFVLNKYENNSFKMYVGNEDDAKLRAFGFSDKFSKVQASLTQDVLDTSSNSNSIIVTFSRNDERDLIYMGISPSHRCGDGKDLNSISYYGQTVYDLVYKTVDTITSINSL